MQESQLRDLVVPILAESGLELDDLDVTPVGRRWLVRITVDGDGPMGRGPLLDDIAAASQRISEALDTSPAVGDAPFTLEVTSRGVGKPLTQPKHYRRSLGRLVRLWLPDGEVEGRIRGVDEETVLVEVGGEERSFQLAGIGKAVVQVELNPPKELLDDQTGGADGDDEEGED